MKTPTTQREAVASTALFCFETEAHGVKSYVWTTTRGKAAAATLRSANDAGYKTRMPDVRCRRRPELDDFDLLDRRLKPNRPYCPDFIQQNTADGVRYVARMLAGDLVELRAADEATLRAH